MGPAPVAAMIMPHWMHSSSKMQLLGATAATEIYHVDTARTVISQHGLHVISSAGTDSENNIKQI